MKKTICFFILLTPLIAFAQFGVKAGVNFANITNASSINNSSKTGFHVGLLLAPNSRGIIGSRTELIFSRQGYDYKSGTTTGDVSLDYIMMPQYMSVNITKYFSLMFGGQVAYLLNAKVDSGKGESSGNAIMDAYKKFDYGYGGGIEVHPYSGLLIGARVNISLGKLYDPNAYASGGSPSFIPKVDVKNNLFQIFAGWKFGGTKNSGKKKNE